MCADSAAYYVTFTVVQWLPLFVREEPCRIITDSLNFCISNKGLLVGAFVVMPTHVHAIIADAEADPDRLRSTVDEFRKFTGRRLADLCDTHYPQAFKAAIREEATADRSRRVWQPSKHAEATRSEEFLTAKVNYVHNNPVRAGLVRQPEHWRFSSAGYYASEDMEDCNVTITSLWW